MWSSRSAGRLSLWESAWPEDEASRHLQWQSPFCRSRLCHAGSIGGWHGLQTGHRHGQKIASGTEPALFPEVDPLAEGFIPHGGDYRLLDAEQPAALKHAFRAALLVQGVDWFGWSGMTSTVHSDEDIAATVSAFDRALDQLYDNDVI